VSEVQILSPRRLISTEDETSSFRKIGVFLTPSPAHSRISVQSAPNLLRHSARTAIPFDSNKIRNPHSGLAMPHGIERVLDVININNNIAPAIK
ncbi:MAG: hypothetical protein V2J25_00690, partial [Desulfatiglans sp.]|nr:hypothetical protein [Desulfatiglans sp.]